MNLLYVTDPHGSTKVIRKAFDLAEKLTVDLLIIGGDLQGKELHLLLENGDSVTWEHPISGEHIDSHRNDIVDIEEEITSVGGYGVLVRPEQISYFNDVEYRQETLVSLALNRLSAWISEIETFSNRTSIKVILNTGNDDDHRMDSLIEASPIVLSCNGTVLEFKGLQIAGIAEVPPTPWNTPRELPEEGIMQRLEALQAMWSPQLPLILCAHSPPFASRLDTAPMLDQQITPVVVGGVNQSSAVGSKSIRVFLEEAGNIPLSLHGHIHESGGFSRIGHTLCLNPGSEYGRGILWAYDVTMDEGNVQDFQRRMV